MSFKGNIKMANVVLDAMKERHIPPNISSYTGLILLYCENQRVSDALLVKKELENAGLLANTDIYNAIIEALHAADRGGEATLLAAEALRVKENRNNNKQVET